MNAKQKFATDIRFGSRLSVFLRSLNILRTLQGFLTAATKEEFAEQINNTLTLLKAGTRLTPSEADDKAIAWSQSAVANPATLDFLYAIYSLFIKPAPVVPSAAFGAGPSTDLTVSDLEAGIDEFVAAS